MDEEAEHLRQEWEVSEYVSTGQSNLLHDLEAQTEPEAALIQVPGIGPEFAKRIVEQAGRSAETQEHYRAKAQ